MTAVRPVRGLSRREIRKLNSGSPVRIRKLHRLVRELRSVVPPGGDGDVHDYVTTFVLFVLHERLWRRGNRRGAFVGVVTVYRLNELDVDDGEALRNLVLDAEQGLSPGAVCERLVCLAVPSRSPSWPSRR